VTGEIPETFHIDGQIYPIKPSVYKYIQNYLYTNENITWVSFTEPHIEYNIRVRDGTEKRIKRKIDEMLTNSKIGRKVVSNLQISPI
jgi:ribosomal protein L13